MASDIPAETVARRLPLTSAMTPDLLTLGVDTSGQAGSIGLVRGETVLEERSLAATGRRHARTLVAEIQTLLRAHGASPRDVGLVAVSVGPGSFTGLRVGVVFGKTFSYTTGAPLVAVDTFAALAANAPADLGRVWIVEDAQRGALFAAPYRRQGPVEFVPESPIEILEEAEVLRRAGMDDVFLGPGTKRLPPERCLPAELGTPRGSAVALLGAIEFARGRTVDPFALVPTYIRRSAAEETAERKAALAAQGNSSSPT